MPEQPTILNWRLWITREQGDDLRVIHLRYHGQEEEQLCMTAMQFAVLSTMLKDWEGTETAPTLPHGAEEIAAAAEVWFDARETFLDALEVSRSMFRTLKDETATLRAQVAAVDAEEALAALVVANREARAAGQGV